MPFQWDLILSESLGQSPDTSHLQRGGVQDTSAEEIEEERKADIMAYTLLVSPAAFRTFRRTFSRTL